jgi:hypothetical protein
MKGNNSFAVAGLVDMRRRLPFVTVLFALVLPPASTAATGDAAAPARARAVYARVALLAPEQASWRLHLIAHHAGAKQAELYAGSVIASRPAEAGFTDGPRSTWIDISRLTAEQGAASVRFIFETRSALGGQGVKARFDFATAGDESAIVRSITEHDPGNVIAFRIPSDLSGDKARLASIREDAQRRLDEVTALHLPPGPLPKKIWCMTGFRSNGQFYTDPAIAEMDFDTIRMLGMNGFWEQNGGQPGDLRRMAAARGIDRSTVYWRNVESPPRDPKLEGATPLVWDALEQYIDRAYSDSVAAARKAHPNGLPTVIADLMDEPDGQPFDGPDYQRGFRDYAAAQGLAPQFFGRKAWDQVLAPKLSWREFFKIRSEVAAGPLESRRLFYWTARFWNRCTARLYAMATRKVEQLAPGVGTRVNFGPPWWYDYGTLPRGIDAFEFGRLRGVSLGFNEDWVGNGNARVPMEMNTMLMDWSRAAARPAEPLVGCYITRDANRTAVKLRAFACLAREAKIFDFYYYGPAYTFFDHWSDNLPMVQGVAELIRDLGQVDEILWEGRAPRPQVALFYSRSWPVWKEDDSEQCEQMMVYLSLLHAGLPVDIVSDDEMIDGRFAARAYRCLYVVNESVLAAAAAEIERWVRGGGRLWCSGWAGARDEYNTPTDAWNGLLGIRGRSWQPAGDLKRLGQPLQPDDWRRPIFGRETKLDWIVPATRPANGISAARDVGQRAAGAGQVCVVPWTAGKEYMDGAREIDGQLAKAVVYPTDGRRSVITGFAAACGALAPATTSADQILAWPLWTQHQGVILLANFSGQPAQSLTVRFASPLPVNRLRSIRHGELPFARQANQQVEAALPMREVTDILVLE